MKRLFVMFLVIALAFSVVGCNDKEKETAVEGENKTLTYWVGLPSTVVSVYQSFNDVAMYKELEKITGVHIDFIHPPTGQEQEQFSLMLASKDYPDLIESSWYVYPGGQAKAIKDNVIIPLNDLMPKYAPDCYKIISENPEFNRLAKTDEGDYFMFPSINGSNNRVFGGLILRADWLEDLNLPVPTTIDEWETTLRAFKEEKGATAPFTAQFALVNSSGLVNGFNGAFDVGKRLYIDGKTVKFGPMEDAYKDWLELMHRWYKEGLLDMDYATNTGSAVTAKMSNGEAGATFGYIGGTIGSLLTMNKEKNPEYDLVAAPYLTSEKGKEPHFAALESAMTDTGSLVITSACEDPVLATKWANTFYTEEGINLRLLGVEGLSYNDVDGFPKFVDEITNNKEGISITEMLHRYCRVSQACPGYTSQKLNEDTMEQIYVYDRQMEALRTWSAATEGASKHMMPGISSSSDDADELSALNGEIHTYVDEMVFKFIKGDVSLDKFDEFRDTLKKMNVKRFIEINQNAYDRFMKR